MSDTEPAVCRCTRYVTVYLGRQSSPPCVEAADPASGLCPACTAGLCTLPASTPPLGVRDDRIPLFRNGIC